MSHPLDGQIARIDLDAESDDDDLPAFLAPPPGAPAYYGFPVLENSELEGFSFGAITDPNRDEPARWGDAYAIAPNGSRAGIVWQMGEGETHEVCPPSAGRWGVYGFYFSKPVQSDQDLLENLHAALPAIKEFYAAAAKNLPESVAPFPPLGEA